MFMPITIMKPHGVLVITDDMQAKPIYFRVRLTGHEIAAIH